MRRTSIPAAILAAGVCAGCSVQTIGAVKGDLTLYAIFDDVQNLVMGHSVQLADVTIGSVAEVQLKGYRAKVAMSIADGRRIPKGTTASIAKTSILGETFVQLTPPGGRAMRAGPYLASGATITKTSVRPGLESVTKRVAPILTAASGKDIDAIVTSLSGATKGKGEQLNKIIAQAAELSDSYAAAAADLAKVLDGMARLGDSLERGSRELERLPEMVSLAAERVRKDRAELKTAVRQLVRLGESFNETVQERHAPRMRKLLVRIDDILGAMTRGKEQLKAFTELLNTGLINAPSITFDGQAIAHVWLAGFLPATEGGQQAPDDPARELRRLLAPK